MPDIALRFHKDMLVLSAPIDTVLARQGVDVDQDREFINLIEPEAIRDAYLLEQVAGAQCLVTNTAGITPARLAHFNMEGREVELATAALTVVKSLKPQHVLAEIGPTLLPLDPSSAASLNQDRDQYTVAVKAFGDTGFDAFFLNGMTDPVDMQCALMGARKCSDLPIFASLDIDRSHRFDDDGRALCDALQMMQEYGADVVGFATGRPLEKITDLIDVCREYVEVPLLAQIEVGATDAKQQKPTGENPYFTPDVLVEAATQLRGHGVQFLRAVGNATPAYTGSLVAASDGFDVMTGTR